MLTPYLPSRRGPGAYVAPGSGNGDGDGGFVEPPVVVITATGDVTINGKVKPGSFGKFVVPFATVRAGGQYTFRYTPHFSQLAQQGKLAMVGFGFKNSNDFHIVGLRGDGSTGLDKYKVYGTPPNGWNKDTGHTTTDGGAAASGTQAGPNWLRVTISTDGTNYSLQSSTDGSAWNTEFSGAALSPFTDTSGVLQFGGALWFNNADAGPFSIDFDHIGTSDMAVIVFQPYDNEPPTTNYATLDTRNSRPVLEFDTTTQEAAFFSRVLPVTYGGNGLTVDVYFAADTATTGTIGWDAAIERIDVSSLDTDTDSFAAAQTITAVTVPGTSGQILKSSVAFTSGAQMDSLAAGEAFRLRIRRDVANDTAAGDAQLFYAVVRET
jgi:hypothetical protein